MPKYPVPDALPCPECNGRVHPCLTSKDRYGERTPHFITFCYECINKKKQFISRSRYKHISVKRWNEYVKGVVEKSKTNEEKPNA